MNMFSGELFFPVDKVKHRKKEQKRERERKKEKKRERKRERGMERKRFSAMTPFIVD